MGQQQSDLRVVHTEKSAYNGHTHTTIKEDQIFDAADTKAVIKTASKKMIDESDRLLIQANQTNDNIEKAILNASGEVFKSSSIILDEIGKSIEGNLEGKMKECDDTCKTKEELKECYRKFLLLNDTK